MPRYLVRTGVSESEASQKLNIFDDVYNLEIWAAGEDEATQAALAVTRRKHPKAIIATFVKPYEENRSN